MVSFVLLSATESFCFCVCVFFSAGRSTNLFLLIYRLIVLGFFILEGFYVSLSLRAQRRASIGCAFLSFLVLIV